MDGKNNGVGVVGRNGGLKTLQVVTVLNGGWVAILHKTEKKQGMRVDCWHRWRFKNVITIVIIVIKVVYQVKARRWQRQWQQSRVGNFPWVCRCFADVIPQKKILGEKKKHLNGK